MMFHRWLVLALGVVLGGVVGCREVPSEVPWPMDPAHETLEAGLPSAFPWTEGASAQEAAQERSLRAALERADQALDRRREAQRAEASQPRAPRVNVVSATGAPPRTQEGDYARFKALHSDEVEPQTIERNANLLIRFDRDVVDYDQVGELVGAEFAVVDIEPHNAVELRWADRATLMVQIQAPWDPGVRYEVTLRAERLAPSGARPLEPFAWAFVARDDRTWVGSKMLSHVVDPLQPRFMDTWPGRSGELGPGERIMVAFDQPVEPEWVERDVLLIQLRHPTAREGAAFTFPEFRLEPVGRDVARHGRVWPASHVLQLVPKAPLVPGADVQVRLSSQIMGPHSGAWYSETRKAGPFEAALSCPDTEGPGARLGGHWWVKACGPWLGEVDAYTDLRFVFSNEIPSAKMERWITIEPEPNSRYDGYGSGSHRVSLRLNPGQTYRVTLSGDAEDIHGTRLGRRQVYTLRAREEPLLMRLKQPHAVVEPGGPHVVPLEVRNVSEATVRATFVPRSRLASVLAAWGTFREWSRAPLEVLSGEPVETWTVRPKLPRGATLGWDVSLERAMKNARGRGGLLVYEIAAHDATAQRPVHAQGMLQVTGLGLALRAHRDAVHVWATRLSDGAPVEGADVVMQTTRGDALAHLKTDARGLAVWRPAGPVEEAVFAVANSAELGSVFARVGGSAPHARGASASLHVPHADRRNTQPDARDAARLFTDRGIYRPGQRVHAKLYVWHLTTTTRSPLEHREVELKVTDPKDKVVHEETLTLDAYGGAEASWELSAASATGRHTITLRKTGEAERLTYTSFSVEAYRAPGFEVRMKTRHDAGEPPSAPGASWVPGEGTTSWEVEGKYLFGAPMAHAEARWTLTRWRRGFYSNALYPYRFRDARHRIEDGSFASGVGVLDAQGRMERALDIAAIEREHGGVGPWYMEAEATVVDVDQQTVSARRRFEVWDRDRYVGVRVRHADGADRLFHKGAPVEVDVVAVTPDQDAVGDVAARARLVHEAWHTVERRGPGGSYTYVQNKVETVESTCDVRTTAQLASPATCRLVPKATGRYWVIVESEDGQGRKLEVSDDLYVEGPGPATWSDADVGAGYDSDDDDAPLSLDDGEFRVVPERYRHPVGAQARVLIQSPWPKATAWVTVERGEVLHEQVVALDGASRAVEVPVLEALRDCGDVVVTLVRGRLGAKRDGRGRDRLVPASLTGRARLCLDREEERLHVTVTPEARQALPGASLDVAVRVRDGAKRPREGVSVTVWAVDEAVLQLTDYDTYRLRGFEWLRPGSLDALDTRDHLLTRLDPRAGARRQGGDGAFAGPQRQPDPERLRETFLTTPLFVGRAVTDAKGEVHVPLKLPDNLTRFRVMAFALDRSGEGATGEGAVTARQPLMLRPVMPRFARLGDRFELGASVTNITGHSGVAHVRFTVEGLELWEAPLRQVRVEHGATVKVAVPVSAEVDGDARVRIEAVLKTPDGDAVDRVERPLTVTTPGQWSRPAASGLLTGTRSMRVRLPPGIDASKGGLTVQASRSPLSALSGGLDALVRYPHGCLEQTTSALLPMLALRDRLEVLGMSASREALDARVSAGLERLESMRVYNGLAYWPGLSEPHLWGMAYAALALSEARDAGYSAAEPLRFHATFWLGQALEASPNADPNTSGNISPGQSEDAARWPEGASDSAQALALYALSRDAQELPPAALPMWHLTTRVQPQAQPMNARIEATFARLVQRREALPTDALAWLVLAARGFGHPEATLRTLRAELEGRLRRDIKDYVTTHPRETPGRWLVFGSRVRDDASALLAMVALDPHADDTTGLAKNLLWHQRGGRWGSTQDNAWALLALSAWSRAVRGPSDGTSSASAHVVLRVGDEALPQREVVRDADGAFTARWPMSALAAHAGSEVTLEPASDGAGPLFVHLSAELFKPLALDDLKPEGQGMALFRRFETLDGEPLGATLPLGELVRVRVWVEVDEETPWLAISAPMPAGLEPVNPELAISGRHPAADRHPEHPAFARDADKAVRDGSWWFHHVERRDDTMRLYASGLPEGVFELTWLMRATTRGTFTVPPARLEAMYALDRWARSDGRRVEVR